MGTRGTWGFVLDGEEKLTYNHYDSYPAGLGAELVEWLRGADLGVVREKVKRLRMVDSDGQPTPEEAARLAELGVSSEQVSTGTDWYAALRNAQGNPTTTLVAGYMTDDRGFAGDSLFCEWGYVIDLDAGRFEVYRGFQEGPHHDGRFADMEPKVGVERSYYPIRLVRSYPLAQLPTTEEFVQDFEESEVET